LTTLDRLRDGGLVRRRAAAAGSFYEITRRGRAELRLQRLIWTVVAARHERRPDR
jgi:DNA-binding PadR family transcriptional regulator